MITFLLCSILCAVLGSFFNCGGVELIIRAFELSGGEAIGTFFIGVSAVLASLIAFSLFAMSGKAFMDNLKERMKG